jgi:hypothetical protein
MPACTLGGPAGIWDLSAMSSAFVYETCDIPEGMRLDEWRRRGPQPRRNRRFGRLRRA